MNVSSPYSLDIVSILLMILLFIMLRGKQKANILRYKIYNWLLFITFLTSTFNLLYVEGTMNMDVYGAGIITGIEIIYNVLLFLITILMTIYILSLVGISFNTDAGWKSSILIPFAIGLFAIIATVATGGIKTGLEDGLFHIDSKMVCTLAFSTYYLGLWFFIFINYGKIMNKVAKIYLRGFIVLHITVLVAYALTGIKELLTFEIAIELIVMIYAIQSPDDLFDKSDAILYSHLLDAVKLDVSRDKDFSLLFIRLHDEDVIVDSFGDNNANRLLSKAVQFLNDIHRTATIYRVDRRTLVVKLARLDEISLHAIRVEILKRFENEFRIGDLSAKFTISIVALNAPEELKKEDSFEERVAFIKNAVIPIGADISYDELVKNDKEADIIEAVKYAVENNKFKVFYQPIYSTRKKRIVAAEALIRLFDDKLGFVSPEIFIPLAEREGYILTIGEFVFTEVCRFYSENKLKDKGIDYIEVNLSAVQCMQYKLADEFVEIMHKYGLNSSQINFEITESSAMNRNSAVELNINYFVDHGVDLSLDDYGTGYSNISYLYNLPFAFMKIDKSILWSSDKNDRANITLNNIFKMAKNLKMRTVVEGVETEDHIKKLLKLDCDYFQGYYFSRPVNENDFIKYLDEFTVPEVCMA